MLIGSKEVGIPFGICRLESWSDWNVGVSVSAVVAWSGMLIGSKEVGVPFAGPLATPFSGSVPKPNSSIGVVAMLSDRTKSRSTLPFVYLYASRSHPKSHMNCAIAKGKLIIQTSILKKLVTMMTIRRMPSIALPTHAPTGSRRASLTSSSPETSNLCGMYSTRRNLIARAIKHAREHAKKGRMVYAVKPTLLIWNLRR